MSMHGDTSLRGGNTDEAIHTGYGLPRSLRSLAMTVILSCLAIVLTLSPAHAQDITTGLIGHWKLDETSGTDVIDYASSNNGSMQGGLSGVDSVLGRLGTALDFDGSDDHILIADNDIWETPPFTVSLWAKLDVLPSVKGSQSTMYFKRHSLAPWFSWKILVHHTGIDADKLYFVLNDATELAHVVESDDKLVPEQWYHIVGTVNGSLGVNLYINGVLQADGLVIPSLYDTDDFLRIGNNAANQHDGQIDDVRFYNRALSAADVAELYRTAEGQLRYNADSRTPEYYNGDDWQAMGGVKPTTGGLVGHWKLDEESGTFIDSSGNGNDGSDIGGVTYGSSGILDNSAAFDGADDNIGITTSWSDFTYITMTAWIKPYGWGESDIGRIVHKGDTDAGTGGSLMVCGNNGVASCSNALRFEMDGNTVNGQWMANNVLSLTEWQHVAVTYDKTSLTNDPFFYVNGVPIALNQDINPIGGFKADDNQLWIGSRRDNNRYFNGAIDDVRIYNRALSAEEIGDLYYQGSPATQYYAFVSDTLPDGDLLSEAQSRGFAGTDGVLAGDYICQNEADAAGLPGTYYAWLSGPDADDNAPADRFVQSTVPYVMPDSPTFTKVADDWGDLTDGSIDNDLNVMADGTLRGGSDDIWTNVETDGTMYDDIDHCLDWTSSSNGPDSRKGSSNNSDNNWTNNGTDSCDDSGQHIYCFQQTYEGLCSNPARAEGSIIYNEDDQVAQYCDGENWQAMGPVPGAGSGGCSNPSRGEGSLIYNRDYRVMQYCDGDEWVAVGEFLDPCASSPAIGAVCFDGSVYAGLSPDGNVPMYTTPSDAPATYSWGGSLSSYTTSGVTDTVTGEANTTTLVATDSNPTGGFQPHPAAVYCDSLVAHGYDDWYLPAYDELDVLAANYVAIGNFLLSPSYYYASTEQSQNYAYRRAVDTSWATAFKHITWNVRCVRKD